MPDINNDPVLIAENAKNSLALMNQMALPLSPENYQLWYTYIEGSNQELTEEVNKLMASSEQITPEACTVLHDRFFGSQKEVASVRRVHDETQRILKTILDEIISTHSQTSDYGKKLEVYSSKLNEAKHVDDMREIIADLIIDTGKMADSSRQLEDRLRETTEHTEKLKLELRTVQQQATTDILTGLSNRRAFDDRMKERVGEARKNGSPLCLLMLDIDHFKSFNDKYGHRVGDAVLQVVSGVLRETARTEDTPARYGGEEFAVIAANQRLDVAIQFAEQIRRKISEKRFKLAKTGEMIGNITVSVGISLLRASDTPETLIERADQALYRAKDSGRNNVKTE